MGGWLPEDIANESLDAVGWPDSLGSMEDGSHAGQIVLRKYRQCLMQLERAAPWDFCRKQAPLLLLADASGNTAGVGTRVPSASFIYEYAWPTDCLKARFIPQTYQNQADQVPAQNIFVPPAVPATTGIGDQPILGQRMRVARFLVATDFNYPVPAPVDFETQGISPTGARTVILTNQRNAQLVYTAYVNGPTLMDPLFRGAFVAYMGSEIALPIWAKTDRKFGMQMQQALLPKVKAMVTEARLTSANEGGPSSADLRVDWMDTRRVGGSSGPNWGAGWAGNGDNWGGDAAYDSLPLSDGAIF